MNTIIVAPQQCFECVAIAAHSSCEKIGVEIIPDPHRSAPYPVRANGEWKIAHRRNHVETYPLSKDYHLVLHGPGSASFRLGTPLSINGGSEPSPLSAAAYIAALALSQGIS